MSSAFETNAPIRDELMKLTSSVGGEQISLSGSRFRGKHNGLPAHSARVMHSSVMRFSRKVLKATHTQEPRVINVDKNAAYPKAIDELKANKALPKSMESRQKKYLNNVIEQDHWGIQRLVKPGTEFGSFNTV